MSLTLSTQPGFTEIPDSDFSAGSAASDSDLKSLNGDTKFGVVRNEQFWGYYRNGETVQLPVSPADGYAYSRAELRYTWSIFYTGGCNVPCNGTQTPPFQDRTGGPGQVLSLSANVDQSSGLVSTVTSYYKDGAAQTNTTDGVLMVMTHAQRQR